MSFSSIEKLKKDGYSRLSGKGSYVATQLNQWKLIFYTVFQLNIVTFYF